MIQYIQHLITKIKANLLGRTKLSFALMSKVCVIAAFILFSNAVSEWYLQVNDMPLEFKQELLTDGSLNKELLSLSTARAIRKAGPWGQRFEEPLFSGKFIVEEARLVGGIHAKLKLRTPQGSKLMDAIAFSYLKNYDELPRGEIEVVYSLDINYWQGVDTLQLMVKHIQHSAKD